MPVVLLSFPLREPLVLPLPPSGLGSGFTGFRGFRGFWGFRIKGLVSRGFRIKGLGFRDLTKRQCDRMGEGSGLLAVQIRISPYVMLVAESLDIDRGTITIQVSLALTISG